MSPLSKIGVGVLFSFCLSFCHYVLLSETLNIANNFWTERVRTLIFDMSISYDKTFPWFLFFFILRPWPSSLTHFLKILTLLKTLEKWVRARAFNIALFVTRPSLWYQDIWPCDFGLPRNKPLSEAFVFHKQILFKVSLNKKALVFLAEKLSRTNKRYF